MKREGKDKMNKKLCNEILGYFDRMKTNENEEKLYLVDIYYRFCIDNYEQSAVDQALSDLVEIGFLEKDGDFYQLHFSGVGVRVAGDDESIKNIEEKELTSESINEKMHDIFTKCKEMSLESCHKHLFDDVEQEEKEFFIAMSDFFLHYQQKKIIEEEEKN